MKYFHTFLSWKKIFEVDNQVVATQSQPTQPADPKKKEVKLGDRFEVKDSQSNKLHQIEIVGPKSQDGNYDPNQNFIEVKIDQKQVHKLDKKQDGSFGGFTPEGGQMSGNLVIQRPIELVGGKRSFEVIARERKGGKKLDYTKLAQEKIWQGENYNKVWKVEVKKAMDNPQNMASIIQYLEEYNGQDAQTVKRYLESAKKEKGGPRAKLERLATDGKIGPFHSIIRDAIEKATGEKIIPPQPGPKPPDSGPKPPDSGPTGPKPPEKKTEPEKEPEPEEKPLLPGRRGEVATTAGGRGDFVKGR